VVVVSARPGRIKLDHTVPLQRPRHDAIKTSPAFSVLKAELTGAVRAEVLAALAALA
jgi:ABC-type nitrate/sulfonate/bicarbonate transport system ATPase subunit